MNKIIITKKAKIYFLITILWTMVIFSFSLQSGDSSSQLSSGFGVWIVETFLVDFMGKFDSISTEQVEFFHLLLRKCAHFFEYLLLGILMRLSLQQIEIRYRNVIALIACVFAASIDEMIQLFVPGRCGRIADVLIDSVGALCGICFTILLGKLFRKMQ